MTGLSARVSKLSLSTDQAFLRLLSSLVELGSRPRSRARLTRLAGAFALLLLLGAGLGSLQAQTAAMVPNWGQQPLATAPPARIGGAMAYDTNTSTAVLFGGSGSSGLLNDTWTWNGTSWTPQSPATSPTARSTASMAYDVANNTIVLFGGLNSDETVEGDTWTWNGTTWTLTSTTGPSARSGAAMAYDTALGKVVLFGGFNGTTEVQDTWTWNGSAWTQLTTTGTPPARTQATMAYDAGTSSLVLFGGNSGSAPLSDTWTFHGTTWSQQSPATVPPARYAASMAYDASTSSIVLFGGQGSGAAKNDTWTWNGTTWTQQFPATPPPAREFGLMAYDTSTSQMVLFGGLTSSDLEVNDTWIYPVSSANFGPANVCPSGASSPSPCSLSATLTFQFTAAGSGVSASVVTQGATGLDFTDAGGGTCDTNGTGYAYAIGNTCTVKVTFTPKAPGLRIGAVTLQTSAATVATEYVSGTGQGPAVGFMPPTETSVVGSGLTAPWGVAVDAAGNVYASSYNGTTTQIYKIAPNGSATAVGAPGLALGIAVDASGRVLYAEYDQDVVVVVPPGCVSTKCQSTVPATGLNGTDNVAVDGAGDVFITSFASNLVFEVTPSGVQMLVPATGLNGPEALAVDAAGDLFIADNGNNRVVEVTPGGVQTTVPATGLNAPDGVAVDAAGDVFISDYGNDRVVEVTPAGVQTTLPVPDGLGGPVAVTVDNAGNVYISDNNNNRIVKLGFTPPSLSYATTAVGDTSSDSPQSVTVQNIGNQPLDAVAPGLTFPAQNFVHVDGSGDPADCSSTFSLAPTLSCNISISFEPSVAGSDSGFVTLSDNALNAPAATQSIAVQGTATAGSQTITFTTTAPSAAGYNTSFTVAASASSGLAVAYTAAGVCTVNATGTYTMTASSGTCTVKANQAGNANYSAATQVTESVIATLATQTISVGTAAPSSAVFGSSFTIAASVPSGLTLSYGASGGCSNTGAAYQMTSGTQACVVTISQAGNTDYAAATPVTETVNATAAAQAIQFTSNAPTSAVAGSSFVVAANSTSGLPIGYTSSGACTNSGALYTMTSGSGTCVVTASQAGNANYSSAAPLTQSVTASVATANLCSSGQTSPQCSATFTVAFNIPAGTTVGSVNVLTTGLPNLDFQPEANDTSATLCTAQTYATATTCTVDVTFAPTALGVRLGAVNVLNGSGGTIASAPIYGSGAGPQIAFNSPSLTTLAGGFGSPDGVAVDANGDVFVADSVNNDVKEIPAGCTTAGCVVLLGGSSPTGQPGVSFNYPQGVALDGNGNLYVADGINPYTQSGQSVKKIPPGCVSTSCVTTVGGGFNSPYGIAVDGSGNVYVGDNSQTTVKEIPAGCTSSSCVTTLGGGLNQPYGVAVDGSGNLYVADRGNNAVKEIPAGCTSSSCVIVLGGGFNKPQGVAVDAGGTIYVSNAGNNTVTEFPAGCTAAIYSSNGCSATAIYTGAFNNLAVDGHGNLLLAAHSSTGGLPELNLTSPPSFSFATSAVGSQSSDSPQSATVWNMGNLPLSFPAPGSGNNPSIGSGFALDPATTCPAVSSASAAGTLAAGATCTYAVDFIPTAGGLNSSSLAITDNNLNASSVTQSIALSGTGTQAPQTISVISAAPISAVYNSQFTVSASVNSGLNLTYAGSGACTSVGAQFTMTSGSGTCTVTISQTGNASYAATQLTESVNATQATQNISVTTTAPSSAVFGSNFTVAASATSGLMLNYAASGGCSNNGATYQMTSGTVACVVTISQTGNSNYSAATPVTESVNATLASQAISFTTNAPASAAYDSSFTVAASAISGLPVTYTSSGACSNTGATYTMSDSAGTCTVIAAQAGNADYAPATAVSQSVTAGPVDDAVQPSGTAANFVFGQLGSFTTGIQNKGGISANSLSNPTGIAVDSNGNVYIADASNYRVLFYPRGSSTATRVYGQGGSFTSNTFNNGGISATSLGSPAGIALDNHGNLYVADETNQRVLVYPSSGSTTATQVYGQGGSFTSNNIGSGATGFSYPIAVAVDSSGGLYVADSNDNRVLFFPSGSTTATRVYGQGGSFTSNSRNNGGVSANSLAQPQALALDAAGNLYVADYFNKRVLFYPSGSTTATRVYGQGGSFTTNNFGTSATSLGNPDGVAVDSGGNLYVSDLYNSRVLFFPAGSTTATQVYGQGGSFTSNTENLGGITAASMAFPGGIAVDSRGNLYVTDNGNLSNLPADNRALVYPQPNNLGSVNVCPAGQSSPAPCTQTSTLTFAISAGTTIGSVNVLTTGVPNLDFKAKASDTSTTLCAPGNYASATSCTVDVTFAPLAPGLRMGAVQLLDGSGNLLAQTLISGIGQEPAIGFPGSQSTAISSHLSSPEGVVVDAAGDIFVANAGGSVLKVPAGCTTSACQTTIPSGPIEPFSLAVDGAGDLYFASSGQVVEVPSQCTTTACETTVPVSGLGGPQGVAVDGAGDLFIADTPKGQVVELPAGCASSACQITVATGLASPQGVAVDASGNLFVSEAPESSGAVLKIPSGCIVTASSTCQTTVGSGWTGPTALAVDAAGDLFASIGTELVEITPSGIQATISTNGLESIAGIALDGTGDLFASDSIGNQVVEINRSQPPSLTFASTEVGSTSSDSPQSIVIENIGNLPLDAVAPGLVVTGPNFAQVEGSGTPADCTSSFALAPGASCNLSLSFTPQTSGTLSSTAVFTDNALNASPSASQTIALSGTATQASQTISVITSAPLSAVYNSQFTVSASVNSGLPLTYAGTGACTNVVDLFTMTSGSGTCTVTISQAGNGAYAPAQYTASVAANQATQTISVSTAAPSSAVFGSNFTVAASATSGLMLNYAASGGCSNNGATYQMTSGTQACVVTISQAGNGNYSSATAVTETVNATTLPQSVTITGSAPSSAVFGSSFIMAANSSSGLPVTYASAGACTNSGALYTMTSATGTCTVTVSQAGDANNAPAQVTQSVSATTLSASSCTTGGTSAGFCSQTFTVAFSIPAGTTIGSVNVLTTGLPNLDFQAENPDSSTTLCEAQTYATATICTVDVTFTPLAVGTRSGAVTLTGPSGNLLDSTLIYGVGQGPAFAFGSGSTTAITPASNTDTVRALALDAAGDAFAALIPSGEIVELPAVLGTPTTIATGLNSSSSLAVDGAGNLYIGAAAGGQVLEIPFGCTSSLCQTTVAGGLIGSSVRVDGAGDLFAATSSQIVELPAGCSSSACEVAIASGLSGLTSMALDASGDIFYVTSAGQLWEISAAGVSTQLPASLNHPSDIAVDAAGDLFIDDTNNQRIVEITPSGVQTTLISGTGSSDAMALDAAGDIFYSTDGVVQEWQRSQAPSFSFANTVIGSTSSDSPQSIAIANIGNQPLDAVAPGLVVTGPNFVQVAGSGTPADCTSSFALAPGTSCNLSVSFTPQTPGPLSSTAVFTDNAFNANPSASQTLALSGTALGGTPTVTWPTASAITYGQTLSSSTLSGGSAVSGGNSVAGSFAFTNPATVPTAGTQSESVTFTPTNTTAYNSVTSTVNVQVSQAVPTVAWPTASGITYGQTLASSTLSNGSAKSPITNAAIPGSFAFTTPTTAPTTGSQSESVTFTPTDSTDYSTATSTVIVQVSQAVPAVTWPTASGITYGQTLASSTLSNGSAKSPITNAAIPGSFAFTTPTTAPTAGIQTESVTFTPNDNTDYASASSTVNVLVNKASLTVTWPTASAINYGQTLASSTLSGGSAVSGSTSVPGTFAFTTPTTAPPAGTQSEIVTFTPTDGLDYTSASTAVSVLVNKATLTLTSPTASAITYGQTLASSTLSGGSAVSGTTSVPGTFAFTTPTTAPPAGTQSEIVTFTPTDSTDYSSATTAVSVLVNKATLTLTSPTASAITYGQTLASSTLSGGSAVSGTTSVPGTFAFTTSKTAPTAGTQTESVTFTPTNTTDYATVTGTVSVLVNKAAPTVTWPTASAITYGETLASSTLSGGSAKSPITSAAVPGTFAFTTPATAPATTGSQSVTFTPSDTVDYNTVTGSVTVTVTPAPLATVSPMAVNFGTVYLGTITTQTVTVTNTGDAAMTISNPIIAIVQGGNSNEFVTVNLCPASLAAGKSCTMTVSFVAGPYYTPQTATLTIKDNARGNPQTVMLSATVINPIAVFNPTSLNFGIQTMNTSVTKTVTLTNPGATTLSITGLSVTGTNPAEFTLTPASACGTSLAAGASCTVSVTFKPIAKVSYSATLQLTDNAQCDSLTLPLSGTGH